MNIFHSFKITVKDVQDLYFDIVDRYNHLDRLTMATMTLIEIVSKVILRHAHLSTTQRYLGKATDVEAMRWIENLYG